MIPFKGAKAPDTDTILYVFLIYLLNFIMKNLRDTIYYYTF